MFSSIRLNFYFSLFLLALSLPQAGVEAQAAEQKKFFQTAEKIAKDPIQYVRRSPEEFEAWVTTLRIFAWAGSGSAMLVHEATILKAVVAIFSIPGDHPVSLSVDTLKPILTRATGILAKFIEAQNEIPDLDNKIYACEDQLRRLLFATESLHPLLKDELAQLQGTVFKLAASRMGALNALPLDKQKGERFAKISHLLLYLYESPTSDFYPDRKFLEIFSPSAKRFLTFYEDKPKVVPFDSESCRLLLSYLANILFRYADKNSIKYKDAGGLLRSISVTREFSSALRLECLYYWALGFYPETEDAQLFEKLVYLRRFESASLFDSSPSGKQSESLATIFTEVELLAVKRKAGKKGHSKLSAKRVGVVEEAIGISRNQGKPTSSVETKVRTKAAPVELPVASEAAPVLSLVVASEAVPAEKKDVSSPVASETPVALPEPASAADAEAELDRLHQKKDREYLRNIREAKRWGRSTGKLRYLQAEEWLQRLARLRAAAYQVHLSPNGDVAPEVKALAARYWSVERRDREIAIGKLLAKAAKHGSSDALWRLAQLNLDGQLFGANQADGLDFLELAAAQGNPMAIARLKQEAR